MIIDETNSPGENLSFSFPKPGMQFINFFALHSLEIVLIVLIVKLYY